MDGSVENALAVIRAKCQHDHRLELAVISLESALLGGDGGGGPKTMTSKRSGGGWGYKLESLLQTLLCARLLRNADAWHL